MHSHTAVTLLSPQGPAFDASTRSMSGLVLEWVDKLLCARPDRKSSLPVPRGLSPVNTTPRGSIARTALLALLTHNLDMFLGCIDKCYDPDHVVATGYFQVGGCASAGAIKICCRSWCQFRCSRYLRA